MDANRILVVDDEEDICAILKFNLEKAGYSVCTATSAEEALDGGLEKIDLLLLDVMLGGMSGFEMAALVKGNPITAAIPVIFITARDASDDAVEGLDLGADDYISKPFSAKEVVSRVRAVLRRSVQERPSLESKGIEIDDGKKTVKVDGILVALTRMEFDILKLLHSGKGKVFSRESILSIVWPDDVIVTERAVDVNIARLRKKIGEYGDCIVSRHGFGYCFEER